MPEDEVKKKPPVRRISLRELEAQTTREQAGAIRSWGARILAAEMRADWKEVAAIRAELAATALALEALAVAQEERKRP